jgi:hypothetical protein
MSTDATLKQAGHILTLISQKGLTKSQLVEAISDGTLPDFLEALAGGLGKTREEFRSFLGLEPIISFKIVVDYSMTLKDMISACGCDSKNSYITEKYFPISGVGKKKINVELVKLNRSISSGDACTQIDSIGFRPATIEELLAFGTKFPWFQQEFAIYALGSVSNIGGANHVPCLSLDGLFLQYSVFPRLSGSFRFLAVRKNPPHLDPCV